MQNVFIVVFNALGNLQLLKKTINMNIKQNIFVKKHFTQCTKFFFLSCFWLHSFVHFQINEHSFMQKPWMWKKLTKSTSCVNLKTAKRNEGLFYFKGHQFMEKCLQWWLQPWQRNPQTRPSDAGYCRDLEFGSISNLCQSPQHCPRCGRACSCPCRWSGSCW